MCTSATEREERAIKAAVFADVLSAVKRNDGSRVFQILRYSRGVSEDSAIPREEGGWWTPLHAATHHVAAACVRKLLDVGADVNGLDSRGWTPAHYAVVEHKDAAVLRLLLSYGADPDVRTRRGGVAEYNGARVSLRGKTCMELAQALGRYNMCEAVNSQCYYASVSAPNQGRRVRQLPSAPVAVQLPVKA